MVSTHGSVVPLAMFRVISHQLICNFELTWSLHWQKSFVPKTNNVFIFSRRRALDPAQTCLWSPRLALVPECCCCGPRVSGRSLLHNGLLLRNEPPPLRRQTRRINCKDNCVSCGFREPASHQQLSLWLSGCKGEREPWRSSPFYSQVSILQVSLSTTFFVSFFSSFYFKPVSAFHHSKPFFDFSRHPLSLVQLRKPKCLSLARRPGRAEQESLFATIYIGAAC